jgi:hypothetical protein
MKLVREDLNSVLKPKSEEDIEIAITERLQELYEMDPSEMIESLSDEFNIGERTIASLIIGNIEPDKRYEGIDAAYKQLIEYVY